MREQYAPNTVAYLCCSRYAGANSKTYIVTYNIDYYIPTPTGFLSSAYKQPKPKFGGGLRPQVTSSAAKHEMEK